MTSRYAPAGVSFPQSAQHSSEGQKPDSAAVRISNTPLIRAAGLVRCSNIYSELSSIRSIRPPNTAISSCSPSPSDAAGEAPATPTTSPD